MARVIAQEKARNTQPMLVPQAPDDAMILR
jgi:hypothetical protein